MYGMCHVYPWLYKKCDYVSLLQPDFIIIISTVINWRNTPAYPLATQLSTLLKQYTQNANTYNVNNTVHLTNKLKNIIKPDSRMCSFYITNIHRPDNRGSTHL
jgi:hypothetical protein